MIRQPVALAIPRDAGNTVAIGASGKGNGAGAVYIFVNSGGTWSQQAEIAASDGMAGDGFGYSTSMSGSTLLVGAYGAGGQTGAAYLFGGSGSVWSQQQKLTASGGASNDNFGFSVALSGNTALIGAYGVASQAGAAYIFTNNGSTWSQGQVLRASDRGAQGQFGFSVALNGNAALIGANGPGAHGGTGAAYVFVNQGGTWSQQQELVAVGGAAGDAFGGSVALSSTTALVGAPNVGQTGATYMFDSSGSLWTEEQNVVPSDAPTGFGTSMALSANAAIIGANDAAYIYTVAPSSVPSCVDVVSSSASGASAACNPPGLNSGPPGTWQNVLALLYGGLDLTTGVVDCNQASRRNLVSDWRNLFQNACANPQPTCSDATHTQAGNGVLWHAFRPDDGSAAAATFAALIGLTPAPDAAAVNGFGTSPFCNSLNWDTSASNGNCSFGAHDQFTGPGGVVDPLSKCAGAVCAAPGTGNHRRPPPGTWGDNPDPSQTTVSADVLPTSMQDNDPIRRPCIGPGTGTRPGDNVCNIDGALGLVLPIPDSAFLTTLAPPLSQCPTNACTGFAFGAPPRVFTCALRGNHHAGECPNGDTLFGGDCAVPIDSASGTSQCAAAKATVSTIQVRNLGSPDGRIYNVHMRDGTVNFPGYAHTAAGLDFVGGYGRIHETNTIYTPPGPIPPSCCMAAVDNQLACLVQADPCSIGLATDAAWVNSGTGVVDVNGAAPNAVTCGGPYPL